MDISAFRFDTLASPLCGWALTLADPLIATDDPSDFITITNATTVSLPGAKPGRVTFNGSIEVDLPVA